MREYATPAALRAAVEAKLRERARRLGVPAYIVRRQAALERLLVRLARVAPDRWALKGGFALDTRLGERARVSVDLDADHVHGVERAREDLQHAAIEDLGDHFGFVIVGSEELSEAGVGLAVRYKLEGPSRGPHPCVHSFAKYRSHESGSTATIAPSMSPRAAIRSAAATAVPADPPT